MDKLSTSTKIAIFCVVVVIVIVSMMLVRRESFEEHLEPVAAQVITPPTQPLTPPIVMSKPSDIKEVEPAPEIIKSLSAPVETKEKSHSMELKQPDTPIRPAFYDSGSGVMMAGSEFTPTELLSPWYQTYTGDVKNHFLLDDGGNGSNGLHFNMCSKACCSEQYPLPFKLPFEEKVCANKQKFVPSPYMCNNAWQDTGCVCMTKGQSDFIGGRGGNA